MKNIRIIIIITWQIQRGTSRDKGQTADDGSLKKVQGGSVG